MQHNICEHKMSLSHLDVTWTNLEKPDVSLKLGHQSCHCDGVGNKWHGRAGSCRIVDAASAVTDWAIPVVAASLT